ncbi:MAG: LuxR C-terminal-related transcriptional regulator, partial [Acidimicrobiia bacterium]|nr:LuxR C-terminal-related transcriptional regulator [Acidimicrobiia bacterium]
HALAHAAFLAMLRRQGHSAAELAEKSLSIAESGGFDAVAANAEHVLACARLISGREDEAIDRLVRLEHEAAESGDLFGRTRLAVNLGSGCGEVRKYDDAVRWLVIARGLAAGLDMDQAAAYSSGWLARVAFETGRWDEVADLVDEASGGPSVAHKLLAGYARVTALGALGRTRVRRGDPGGAKTLREALELGADHDFQYLWPVACGLAEDALWRGQPDEGLGWLGPLHEAALATESTWGRGETSYWMWRLGSLSALPNDDEDDGDGGPSLPALDTLAEPFGLAVSGRWQDAADAWELLGCPYEQALSLVDSGEVESLTRAIQLLDDMGARPAAAWARQRLRDIEGSTVPAMPRTSTAANPASITNRQREVLTLLVEGASNQEIADRLFVTKKTIEHHVSAIYSKLGVTGRPSAMVAGRELLSELRPE